MDINLFSKRLRDMLHSRKINQKELAAISNTTEATISRYLSGLHQPEISIVMQTAKGLGVSMDYLCGLTDIPTPKESLGDELTLLMDCYKRADAHDKKTIMTILERYMKPEEKGQQVSLNLLGEKRIV